MALVYTVDGIADIRRWVSDKWNKAANDSALADGSPFHRYNSGYHAGRAAALKEVSEFLAMVELAKPAVTPKS